MEKYSGLIAFFKNEKGAKMEAVQLESVSIIELNDFLAKLGTENKILFRLTINLEPDEE